MCSTMSTVMLYPICSAALSDDTGGAKYGEDENRAVYSTDKDNVTTIVIASPSLDDTGKTIDKTINKIAESYNQSSYHQEYDIYILYNIVILIRQYCIIISCN